MAKFIPEIELRAIEAVVRSQAEPISAREIASRLTSPPSHRTLQFRLKRLVEEGRLVRHGANSRAGYSLPLREQRSAPDEITIPLSERSSRLAVSYTHLTLPTKRIV